MASNGYNSYGTSWANQWDEGPDPYYAPETKKSGGGGGAKKMGDKTKEVAMTGAKKVKEGTIGGFKWIKDKYQKSKNKH